MSNTFYIEEEFTGEYDEISTLFQTAYSLDSPICNPKYLQWLYGSNPSGSAIISCARDSDTNKLVGVYIVNPVDLWLQGEKVSAALSLNTFSHQDYRGQGMFTRLAKTCYEFSTRKSIQCIIGFPNQMSYGGFIKKLGFEDMGSIPYLVKPLNYLNLAKNLISKTKSALNISDIIIKTPNDLIELNDETIDQLEGFFNDYRKKSSYQTFRSANYYKWRFINNPINQYRVFAKKTETGEISAIAVISAVSGKTKDVQIVDFCCLDKENGEKLLKTLLKECKSNFSFARLFAQKETREFQVVSALGFVSKEKFSREKVFLPFIFKRLQEKEFLIPFDQWHITMSDTDVV